MEAIRKIDKQIELEQAAYTIYDRLRASAGNEELKNLWHRLSVHERYHAVALERLKNTLSMEELEREAHALDEGSIDAQLARCKELMSEVSKGVTERRAFEIAIDMELSEISALFLKEGKTEMAPYLIHSLGAGTRSHLLMLYDGVKKFFGEKEGIPYMEKFKKLGII